MSDFATYSIIFCACVIVVSCIYLVWEMNKTIDKSRAVHKKVKQDTVKYVDMFTNHKSDMFQFYKDTKKIREEIEDKEVKTTELVADIAYLVGRIDSVVNEKIEKMLTKLAQQRQDQERKLNAQFERTNSDFEFLVDKMTEFSAKLDLLEEKHK